MPFRAPRISMETVETVHTVFYPLFCFPEIFWCGNFHRIFRNLAGMQKERSKAAQGVLLKKNFNTLLNQALQQRGIDITTEVINLLTKRCMNKFITSIENMSNSCVREVFSCRNPENKSQVLCKPHSSSSSSLGKICG